ncbi:ABC-2 type transport system ATP-binding protein [Kitasatospora sp. MAA4]|uniref:ABC transporter ATP-binding protein n=1 Tax=Kitasatospora sp. MAA4 TaxID=3035093 RepID=UPI0024766A7E|nr:ABC transporter ATP-binding protein [Kitasatospora sp. MAA4]MDH6131386.1 ABC-2 type transport system ATP-binding protein [Kitasatospora sp. MAA4]
MSEDRSTASSAPAVDFRAVSKHFGPVRAVDELSLQLPQGRTIALLGPNGAGKSTSIDLLLGLRKPTGGTVRVLGGSPREAVNAGRIGVMLQSGGLMREVTVREFLTLITQLHPKPLEIGELLERANITDIADRKVDKLSGGQTQRVRFAVAIAGENDLLVLDEPTTGMDVENRQIFWHAMNAEARRGKTILFATHYLEEADQAADLVVVINKGRLLAEGTAAEIKAMAGFRRVAFRLPGIREEQLLAMPGVRSVDLSGGLARIQTSDSDATLYAVLDAGHRPTEIEVTALGLEQAFIAITEQDNSGRDGEEGES